MGMTVRVAFLIESSRVSMKGCRAEGDEMSINKIGESGENILGFEVQSFVPDILHLFTSLTGAV